MEMSKTPCMHEPLSAAVQRCCDARNRIFVRAAAALRPQPSSDNPNMDAEKLSDLITRAGAGYQIKGAASAAYRYAMPDPSTRQGIKDYIACVLHGMTVEAIGQHEGASLLAGARIALAGLKHTPPPGAQKAKTFSQAENETQPTA
jgi:hypothetical protein